MISREVVGGLLYFRIEETQTEPTAGNAEHEAKRSPDAHHGANDTNGTNERGESNER